MPLSVCGCQRPLNPGITLGPSNPMLYPIYRPIIWLTISMIVGTLAGEAFPGHGPWVLTLAVVSGVALVICLKRKMPVLVPPQLLRVLLS